MEENQTHIPDGWVKTKVNDITISINDKRKQIKSSEYLELGTFPVIDQSEKFICGFTDEKDKVIFENLPVTIFGDHTRHTKFINFPFVCGADGTQVLKPKDKVDDKFYYYLISNASILIGNHGYDRHFKHLKEFKTTYPKYTTEQTTIANILSKTDQAIANTEALIAKYTRIKTGLMQDLLTNGIGNDEFELVPTDLKNIKAKSNFRITTLKTITKVRQGYQIAISARKKEEGENRFVYITVQYLNNPKKYLEYIENPPLEVISKYDDILFTRTGNTGQIVTDIVGVYHNNFFKVDFDKKLITKEYLLLFLQWKPVKDLILELAGTTTIPDLKHKDFYSIPIFFPKTLEEQNTITNSINKANEVVERYETELSKLQSLKTGLMQDLLSGKVRVRI